MKRADPLLYLLPVIAVIETFCLSSAVAQQKRPMIYQIEPSSGPPGSSVHILGRRFSGEIEVKLGDRILPIEQSMLHRITVKIPADAESGHIIVKTVHGVSRGPEFRVLEFLPAPEISSFGPLSGPPGSVVSIHGRNFSSLFTRNIVLLGDNPVVIKSASPTELQVIVPQSSISGRFRVEVLNAGTAESHQPFTVTSATEIVDIIPHRGAPGERVTIVGNGFAKKNSHNRVFLNNQPVRVLKSSTTKLLVEIPKGASSGRLLVDVQGAGRSFSKDAFGIQYLPEVVGFTPVSGSSGKRVTIRGTNFSSDLDDISVKLGNTSLKVLEADNTELLVEVPREASSGKFSVKVHEVGPSFSENEFKVLPPMHISQFQPHSGPAGTVVTIQGNGFSEQLDNNIVRLGNRQLQVISASSTKLQVRISPGPSGVLQIAVSGNGVISGKDPFVVMVPPRLTSFEPKQGEVGTDITLRGNGFGTNAAVFKAKMGSLELEVRSVSEKAAIVRVVSGAQTGPISVTIPLHGSSVSDEVFQVLEVPPSDHN